MSDAITDTFFLGIKAFDWGDMGTAAKELKVNREDNGTRKKEGLNVSVSGK